MCMLNCTLSLSVWERNCRGTIYILLYHLLPCRSSSVWTEALISSLYSLATAVQWHDAAQQSPSCVRPEVLLKSLHTPT